MPERLTWNPYRVLDMGMANNTNTEIITRKDDMTIRYTMRINGDTAGWVTRFLDEKRWTVCFYDSCQTVQSMHIDTKRDGLDWLASYAERQMVGYRSIKN